MQNGLSEYAKWRGADEGWSLYVLAKACVYLNLQSGSFQFE